MEVELTADIDGPTRSILEYGQWYENYLKTEESRFWPNGLLEKTVVLFLHLIGRFCFSYMKLISFFI
jgi:hypothetical protein